MFNALNYVANNIFCKKVATKLLQYIFLTKDEHKDQHKTTFKHSNVHVLAKSATAEGIDLPSLSGRV